MCTIKLGEEKGERNKEIENRYRRDIEMSRRDRKNR